MLDRTRRAINPASEALDDAPMVWIAEAERASAYWDYLAGFVNLPTLRYEFWRLNFARSK